MSEQLVTTDDVRQLIGNRALTGVMRDYVRHRAAPANDQEAAQYTASYRTGVFLAAIELSRNSQPVESPPGTPVRSPMAICALAAQALEQAIQEQPAELVTAGV
jgi:hypothetical protein